MKTVEIIHLRLAANTPQNLVNTIHDSIGLVPEEVEVRLYHHSKLANDFAVHLHREASATEGGPSEVGTRLVALLRDFGMVAHSVWIECCDLPKSPEPDEGRLRKKGA